MWYGLLLRVLVPQDVRALWASVLLRHLIYMQLFDRQLTEHLGVRLAERVATASCYPIAVASLSSFHDMKLG